METNIIHTTLWRAVRKHLRIKLYKLQFIKALDTDDMENHQQVEDEESEKPFVFLNGKINKLNI